MPETNYGIEKESLNDLLREAGDGSAQLPDFQRGWVWDDNRIRSLLASISLTYPVGAVMMLQAGGDSVRFKQRPLEGASPSNDKPDRLILDGQQRLTSLFQSLLLDQPVETQDQRGKKIKRWYYIDMKMALDPNSDREDAILSVPEDKIVRTFRNEVTRDYSTPDREYEDMVFPLSRIFSFNSWHQDYIKFWMKQGMEVLDKKMDIWSEFYDKVIDRFGQYHIPVIELGKNTPKEAVCQVFEKVNTGGVTLTVFELLTATFAADDFELRPDWEERKRRLTQHSVLRNVAGTDFLQAITLLATRERREQELKLTPDMDRPPAIGCKRADMLRLTLEEYKQWADPLMDGFERAAFFLHSEHVFDAKFLPYGSQLVPLAAILTVLDKKVLTEGEKDKLAQWYWCGVFGELYGGTTETRFSRDLPDVVEWMRGGKTVPRTVEEAQFRPDRLLSLRTRNSAAYKGVYSLILREGARDWMASAEMAVFDYFGMAVDIHHIFPQAWCRKNAIDAKRCDSIVNKTPLSATTNQMIGGRAPSEYSLRIERRAEIDEASLNGHLQSHFVDPDLLRSDNFEGFFEARQRALLDRIGKAMGKRVITGTDIPDEGEEPPVDYETIDEESQTIVDEDE